jgi:hypothetical protein
MRTSETIGAVAAALAKAQGSMAAAKRDGTNSHYGNRYASLGRLLEAAKPSLSSNGLSVVQGSECVEAEGVPPTGVVVTMLLHSSGEWLESTLAVPLAASLSYQELGKALTYLRRYSLASMVGIVSDEDDDAEVDRAARSTPEPATPRPPRRPAPRREASPAGDDGRTVQGVIRDVRQTPWQDTQKTAILIDGWSEGWCSTFDAELGAWLAERRGRHCEIVVKQNGKFWNLVKAQELTPADGKVDPPDDIPF